MECLQSPPTRSGKPVYFLLIEDETGLLQATIFSDTHHRYGHHLYQSGSFLLEGMVEQDERRGFSFVVNRIEDLGRLLSGVRQAASVRVESGAGLGISRTKIS
jgi:error-prone DNA polymerase